MYTSGILGLLILSNKTANRVLCMTPYPVFLPRICWILSIKGVALDTLPLRPPLRFAVLPNPVPDRQPCSALCRIPFLGLLVQTEVMANFPEKYLIGRSFTFTPSAKKHLGYSEKPINDIQSVWGEPVNKNKNNKSNYIAVCYSITPAWNVVKKKTGHSF